jgi:DNA (cytosine-5)-methyltransferase 1
MNPSAVAPTLDQSKDVAIAFDTTQITSPDNHCNPQPSDPCHQLTAQGHAPAIAYGGNNMSGPIDMATACNAHGGTARLDVESETFVVYSESGKGWGKEDVQPLRESQSQSPESGRVVIPLQEVNGRKSKNQNGVGIGIADSHSPMYTLQSGQQYGVALAFTERTRTSGRNLETLADTSYALCNPGSGGRAQSRQVLAPTLTRNHGKQPDNTASKEDRMLIHEGMMVRRLTPRECERLQGFPDDYTLVPYRGKPASDSPRYRAIGNSFAVPVVRWIGQRIQQVDTILASLQP